MRQWGNRADCHRCAGRLANGWKAIGRLRDRLDKAKLQVYQSTIASMTPHAACDRSGARARAGSVTKQDASWRKQAVKKRNSLNW